MGGRGPLKGLHSPSLFTTPRGDKEAGGWIGMPVEEKKKYILQLQNSGSRLTAQRVTTVHTVDVCIVSHWTEVRWTCF